MTNLCESDWKSHNVVLQNILNAVSYSKFPVHSRSDSLCYGHKMKITYKQNDYFLSQYLVFISWWCGCVSVAFVGDIALDKDDLHFFRRDLTENDLPHTTSHFDNTVAGVCVCVCVCVNVCIGVSVCVYTTLWFEWLTSICALIQQQCNVFCVLSFFSIHFLIYQKQTPQPTGANRASNFGTMWRFLVRPELLLQRLKEFGLTVSFLT